MAFEFPEATTVARQMHAQLTGKQIVVMRLSPQCDSLIRQGFVNLDRVALAGRRILSVDSRGKWIFTHLDSHQVFLIALESGGQVRYFSPGEDAGKFHVLLDLDDGSVLVVRVIGWGFVKAVHEDQVETERYPGKLGVSPLDPEAFSFDCFNELLDQNPASPLKTLLTGQGTIAGIGIGYYQEILFRSCIHPARKCGSLNPGERQRLYAAAVRVLSEAVRLGGASTEVDLFGHSGGYVKALSAAALGRPCPNCGTPIERVKFQGAQLYYCPGCQK